MLCSFWNRPEYINLEDEWEREPYLSEAKTFYKLIGLTKEQEKMILGQPANDEETERLEWLIEDINVINDDDFTGVHLDKFLETINGRLEKLVSKDFQIGHAFFINVSSVADFYNAFYQKLIPQLQEYFYGDFGKIGLVLGSDFVKLAEESNKVKFAPFPYDDIESLLEKPIYRINDFTKGTDHDYDNFVLAVKKIYQ